MKILTCILFILISYQAHSQLGVILEKNLGEDYYNGGVMIKEKKHVVSFTAGITFLAAGSIYKLGYGRFISKRSYPILQIGYGNYEERLPKEIFVSIGYTYRFLHVGYDFKIGPKIGLYIFIPSSKKDK